MQDEINEKTVEMCIRDRDITADERLLGCDEHKQIINSID